MENFSINPSSGNNFQLVFPTLPFTSDLVYSKQLSLQLINTGIPDLSLNKDILNWNGKHINSIITDLSFGDLDITFLIDENFDNWKIIYDWIININNNQNITGKNLKEYTTDASLIVYNNFNKPILSLSFINVFPTNLGRVELSFRDGENFLECTATFSHDYFRILNKYK